MTGAKQGTGLQVRVPGAAARSHGSSDAGGGSSEAFTPSCGLGANVFRFDLPGCTRLLVSDGAGAYFTEQIGNGRISSVAALSDGGLERRTILLDRENERVVVL